MACKKPGMRNYVAQAAAHFHHLIVGRGSGYGDGATAAETFNGHGHKALRNAVANLEGFGDSLVRPCTKTQQSKSKVSPIAPLSAVASYT